MTSFVLRRPKPWTDKKECPGFELHPIYGYIGRCKHCKKSQKDHVGNQQADLEKEHRKHLASYIQFALDENNFAGNSTLQSCMKFSTYNGVRRSRRLAGSLTQRTLSHLLAPMKNPKEAVADQIRSRRRRSSKLSTNSRQSCSSLSLSQLESLDVYNSAPNGKPKRSSLNKNSSLRTISNALGASSPQEETKNPLFKKSASGSSEEFGLEDANAYDMCTSSEESSEFEHVGSGVRRKSLGDTAFVDAKSLHGEIEDGDTSGDESGSECDSDCSCDSSSSDSSSSGHASDSEASSDESSASDNESSSSESESSSSDSDYTVSSDSDEELDNGARIESSNAVHDEIEHDSMTNLEQSDKNQLLDTLTMEERDENKEYIASDTESNHWANEDSTDVLMTDEDSGVESDDEESLPEDNTNSESTQSSVLEANQTATKIAIHNEVEEAESDYSFNHTAGENDSDSDSSSAADSDSDSEYSELISRYKHNVDTARLSKLDAIEPAAEMRRLTQASLTNIPELHSIKMDSRSSYDSMASSAEVEVGGKIRDSSSSMVSITEEEEDRMSRASSNSMVSLTEEEEDRMPRASSNSMVSITEEEEDRMSRASSNSMVSITEEEEDHLHSLEEELDLQAEDSDFESASDEESIPSTEGDDDSMVSMTENITNERTHDFDNVFDDDEDWKSKNGLLRPMRRIKPFNGTFKRKTWSRRKLPRDDSEEDLPETGPRSNVEDEEEVYDWLEEENEEDLSDLMEPVIPPPPPPREPDYLYKDDHVTLRKGDVVNVRLHYDNEFYPAQVFNFEKDTNTFVIQWEGGYLQNNVELCDISTDIDEEDKELFLQEMKKNQGYLNSTSQYTDGHLPIILPHEQEERSIWLAARSGDLAALQYFVEEEGVPFDEPEDFGEENLKGRTPLFLACSFNQAPIVRYLLGLGVRDEDGSAFGVANQEVQGILSSFGHTPSGYDPKNVSEKDQKQLLIALHNENSSSNSSLSLCVDGEHTAECCGAKSILKKRRKKSKATVWSSSDSSGSTESRSSMDYSSQGDRQVRISSAATLHVYKNVAGHRSSRESVSSVDSSNSLSSVQSYCENVAIDNENDNQEDSEEELDFEGNDIVSPDDEDAEMERKPLSSTLTSIRRSSGLAHSPEPVLDNQSGWL